MCNLYSHTRPQQAVRDLAEAMGGDWLDSAGNLPPQPAIFPDTSGAGRSEDENWQRIDPDALGLSVAAACEVQVATNVRKNDQQLLKALA